MNDEKLRKTIACVIKLLVEGKYEDLERLDRGKRLNSMDLQRTVESYSRHLVLPSVIDLEDLNIIGMKETDPQQWYVGVNLWTIEEGRSDLTLELTLTDSAGDRYLVELDDLHVL